MDDANRDFVLEQLVISMREIRDDVKLIRLDMVPNAEYIRKTNDYEKRLRSLEKWRYSVPFAFSTVVAGLVHFVGP